MNKNKSNHKGQIELSANFIIVIVISIIIVVGGLALFFRMQKNAQSVVDTLNSQTEDRIKSMMLSDNSHVAVYPGDPVIGPGDAKLIGVGVTNNYDEEKTFVVDIIKVERYTKGADAVPVSDINKYKEITSTKLTIAPHSQGVKGILLRMPGMPEGSKGEYVYTIEINVTEDTPSTYTQYGIVQVYANNP